MILPRSDCDYLISLKIRVLEIVYLLLANFSGMAIVSVLRKHIHLFSYAEKISPKPFFSTKAELRFTCVFDAADNSPKSAPLKPIAIKRC